MNQFDDYKIAREMVKAGEDPNCVFCARAFIWEKETGKKVPKGSRLETTCNNFHCVNPSHAKIVNRGH